MKKYFLFRFNIYSRVFFVASLLITSLLFLYLQKADKKEDIPDDFGSGRMIPTKQVCHIFLDCF